MQHRLIHAFAKTLKFIKKEMGVFRVQSCPWEHYGNSRPDYCKLITRGVYIIDHGYDHGIMFTASAAKKHLSKTAINAALIHDGYYCYASNSTYFIVFLDNPTLGEKIKTNTPEGAVFFADQSRMIKEIKISAPFYIDHFNHQSRTT